MPAYYLFDGEGKLRSFAAGERGLDLLRSTLDRVLAAHNKNSEVLTQAPQRQGYGASAVDNCPANNTSR